MSDLISREAILKHIEKIRQGVQMMDDTHRASIIMNGMYLCEKAVRNQPSAQPERKPGKWIEVNDAYNRISGRCSVCGWESHLYEDDVVGMDYCPNCGARLEAE